MNLKPALLAPLLMPLALPSAMLVLEMLDLLRAPVAGAPDVVYQTHHRIVRQRTDQTEVQQVVAEHAYPIAGQETIPQPGQCYAATDHHGIQCDSNGLLFLSLLCS